MRKDLFLHGKHHTLSILFDVSVLFKGEDPSHGYELNSFGGFCIGRFSGVKFFDFERFKLLINFPTNIN